MLAVSLLAGSLHAAPVPAECIAPAKPGGGFDLTCQLVRDMLRLPLPEPAADVSVKYLPGGIGAVAFDRAVVQRWSDPRVFIAI
jgi:putative tricarboxylic transport membrane protein